MVGDVEADVFAVGDVAVTDRGIGVVTGNANGGADDRGRPNNTVIDERSAILTAFKSVVFMMRYG